MYSLLTYSIIYTERNKGQKEYPMRTPIEYKRKKKAGTKKFGNTMDQAHKDLEEMFVDTLEELGDAMIYLEKGLQILRKKKTLWNIKN